MAELWPGGPLTLPHELWIDGHRVVVPELDNATLLHWLAMGAWWELVPNVLDYQQFLPLMSRWVNDDDDYDFEHMWDVATTILGRLTGLASLDGGTDGYWPGRRLAATALQDWPMYCAWCAQHGVDPLGGRFYEVMGGVYAWTRDRAASQPTPGEDKLNQQLFGPPPYVAVKADTASIPRHVRDQEAAMALAALREQLPGEDLGERTERATPLP